jgi:hypothetical protein
MAEISYCITALNVPVKDKDLEQVYRRSAIAVIPRPRFYGVDGGFQGEGT